VSFSQTTKVRGRVVDASTGEGIPYAGIYFVNSTVGVSSDENGYYHMETRDTSLRVLSATILGFESMEKNVSPLRYNEVNFSLKPTFRELNASVVKPDDRYVRSILRKIVEAKEWNDPERRPDYDCDTYSKIEIDLQNPDTRTIMQLVPKNFMFVYEYMDTSVISGRPYIPITISETQSHYFHRSSPERKQEVIKASRISGFDQEQTAAQFAGAMHIKTNFYDNFLNIFQVEIPSPVASTGTTYYNYYLVDSLDIDGRKTYKIRFHKAPMVSSPTFDGEIAVDAEEYALREVHVKLTEGSNMNWVRDLAIDVENQRVSDSTWFYKQDKIYMDVSVVTRDSSRVFSFLGNRQIDYSNPSFEPVSDDEFSNAMSNVQMGQDVLRNDEDYWTHVRPYELTEKEKEIYEMVDSIKNVRLYKDMSTFARMLATGFLDVSKYFGLGPYSTLYSFNPIEGSRVQMGFRTTREVSEKFRVMAYTAYSFKDDKFKGGGTFEYMFNNTPTRKLTALYRHDMLQLGRGSYAYGSGNIMTSVLAKANGLKMSPVDDYSLSYQHEVSQDVNLTFALEARRIFSNAFVPMVTPDGQAFSSVGYNQASFQARFAWDEIITRGVFDKYYVFTNYPIITMRMTGAVKGIGKNDYSFFRPEIWGRYTLKLPPIGDTKMKFSAGTIVGTVPYPMLYMFQGNGSYSLDTDSFACMDYYEFAADSWLTFFAEHDFKGFFLGKVPLLRRMQLRELAIFKFGYGTLRESNNGIAGDKDFGSVMLFPEGMTTLDRPYVELGVGLTNIFRLLRVDAYWRMTHRYQTVDGVRVPHDNRFVVNVGFDVRF